MFYGTTGVLFFKYGKLIIIIRIRIRIKKKNIERKCTKKKTIKRERHFSRADMSRFLNRFIGTSKKHATSCY